MEHLFIHFTPRSRVTVNYITKWTFQYPAVCCLMDQRKLSDRTDENEILNEFQMKGPGVCRSGDLDISECSSTTKWHYLSNIFFVCLFKRRHLLNCLTRLFFCICLWHIDQFDFLCFVKYIQYILRTYVLLTNFRGARLDNQPIKHYSKYTANLPLFYDSFQAQLLTF